MLLISNKLFTEFNIVLVVFNIFNQLNDENEFQISIY